MIEYRNAYAAGELDKASDLLSKSDLKKDEKSKLLWLMESGTLALAKGDEANAISHFQGALELIDALYTKRLSAKAESFLVNDASDVFYGASYERSYAHYFLAKSYYSRYQKTQDKLDLQGARATILAWDTYFTDLQRSAAPKTIYKTDLMLKVFGGQIHEVSEIRNDKQIALQLYKDALKVLESMGGAFSFFNKKSEDYIKAYEKSLADGKTPSGKLYEETPEHDELKNFLHYKILSLTREIRNFDFKNQLKALKPAPEVIQKVDAGKSNVVIILEEGLIPQKVGKPFNFGLKGAVDSVDNKGAKSFIASVGAEMLTTFAMNKLGMAPSKFESGGNFVFAHTATKLAVMEAAIQFELPVIEEVKRPKNFHLVILDEKGGVVKKEFLPMISENGDIAKVVLEEDVVGRYVKTGTRVAVKHLVAIVAAMQVYRSLQKGKSDGDFLAKTAAMATYIGASKGIAVLEKADTRHWTTLPQAFRMSEFTLPPGKYQVALAPEIETKNESFKVLGNIEVKESGKTLHTFKLIQN